MEFRILGPLAVCENGRELSLGAARQRALLAILILHANEVVSTDRLIDELWGDRPPTTAGKALQVYVSQLRKALRDGRTDAGDGVLVTQAPGYVLRIGPGELDADRFELLLDEGRRALVDGAPELAADKLVEGLRLWRGPPLADFTFDAFAQREIARLEEERLTALEERIEAELALGRHAELVGEINALVDRHPLRERLRGQLMRALYGSGRQAEALTAYADARRALVGELGLEPGPALQELERAILCQDPRLEPARGVGTRDAARQGGGQRAAGAAGAAPRRRRVVVAGVLVLLVVAIAAVVLLAGNGSDAPRVVPANSVGVVDASTGRILTTIPAGGRPTAVAAGEGAVWVTSLDGRTLTQIDPDRRAVVEPVGVGATPSAVAAGEGAIWVTNEFAGTVSRIDRDSMRIVDTIAVGNGPSGVATGARAVWVTNRVDGTVTRIDPATGRTDTIRVGEGPSAVAVGAGGVWVANGLESTVSRIDPATMRVSRRAIALRFMPGALAAGERGVWVTGSGADSVSRIDPATDSVGATIPTGDGPTGIAAGDGSVWVAHGTDGSLAQIEERTGKVVRSTRIGARPDGVAVADGEVWVAVHGP
jgi:YVTN family beta-propeller protein